jgi:dUTP pyrophosphatase
MVPVDNMSNQSYEVKRGERLFQIVSPTLGETMVQFTKLTTDTKRGTGGFGSTGK